MSNEKYQDWSVEQLEAELARIGAERSALKEEAMVVHRVLDKRNVQASATRKLSQLSDAERTELLQQILASAADSEGAIGTPGG